MNDEIEEAIICLLEIEDENYLSEQQFFNIFDIYINPLFVKEEKRKEKEKEKLLEMMLKDDAF